MSRVLSSKKLRKLFKVMIYLIIYLLFILSVIIDFKSKYIWEDESFTYYMIHHSFLNIMKLTAQDVHPFLYYFMAKIVDEPFTNLFTQIKVLRILSIIPYLILLLVGNINIKHMFSTKTSMIFMFSIVTMPTLIDNMYQIRMYGWAILFTTLVFLKFVYVYKNIDKNSFVSFLLITLYALLAAYTHYYALISVAIIYLMFLILFMVDNKHVKYLLGSIGLSIILYLPWLGNLLKQTQTASKGFWGTLPNLHYLGGLFINLFISNTGGRAYLFLFHKKTFIPIFILIVGSLIYLGFRSSKLDKNILIIIVGVLLPIFVISFGIIASEVIEQNVLIVRYVAPCMGVFWLAISMLLGIYLNSSNINVFIKIFIILILIILGEKSYHFNELNIKNNADQFNDTLVSLKKIPKNAYIIYDYLPVASSASSYLNHNYVLGKSYNKKNINIWYKVYPNMFTKNNLKINLSRSVYFIKLDTNTSQNSYSRTSKLSKEFIKKYHHRMIKIKDITFPSDGGKCILYRIDK